MLIAESKEFESMKLRPEEMGELNDAMKALNNKRWTHFGPDFIVANELTAKIVILLYSFIARFTFDEFSLTADMNYIAQNVGRISRALRDICLTKIKNAELTHQMFQFEIMVSKQLFFDDIVDHKFGMARGEHLLSQFGPVFSPHIFLIKVLERHKYIKENIPKALTKNDFLANKTIWELRETETNLLAH